MATIVRISERWQWQRVQQEGFYTDDSLEAEGFIHTSELHQVIEVANYLYRGQQDLVLLFIDTDKLTSEVRYEQLGTDEPFPHVYGLVNVEAVVSVVDFPTDTRGFFHLASLEPNT
jgi:uncharacterized protein (DUF952 family)